MILGWGRTLLARNRQHLMSGLGVEDTRDLRCDVGITGGLHNWFVHVVMMEMERMELPWDCVIRTGGRRELVELVGLTRRSRGNKKATTLPVGPPYNEDTSRTTVKKSTQTPSPSPTPQPEIKLM
ncbi:hypothetical protein K440DRAFT_112584 [Wilcoxina mikolae CBS 423.85]|nr:hypothetical protein K440DRAFT_112584 [Wilcoxina mikolae CBS 423.85]